jgi:hypothetical protein
MASEQALRPTANSIVFALRGHCQVVEKALSAQAISAIALVVGNDDPDSQNLVEMGSDNATLAKDVTIPCVFITNEDFEEIRSTLGHFQEEDIVAVINSEGTVGSIQMNLLIRILGLALLLVPLMWCTIVACFCAKKACMDYCNRVQRHQLLDSIPTLEYRPNALVDDVPPSSSLEDGEEPEAKPMHDNRIINDSCAICLDEFEEGEPLRVLPCRHGFHRACIDPWLDNRSDLCPICKSSILAAVATSSCWRRLCLRLAGVTQNQNGARNGARVARVHVEPP